MHTVIGQSWFYGNSFTYSQHLKSIFFQFFVDSTQGNLTQKCKTRELSSVSTTSYFSSNIGVLYQCDIPLPWEEYPDSRYMLFEPRIDCILWIYGRILGSTEESLWVGYEMEPCACVIVELSDLAMPEDGESFSRDFDTSFRLFLGKHLLRA